MLRNGERSATSDDCVNEMHTAIMHLVFFALLLAIATDIKNVKPRYEERNFKFRCEHAGGERIRQ